MSVAHFLHVGDRVYSPLTPVPRNHLISCSMCRNRMGYGQTFHTLTKVGVSGSLYVCVTCANKDLTVVDPPKTDSNTSGGGEDTAIGGGTE